MMNCRPDIEDGPYGITGESVLLLVASGIRAIFDWQRLHEKRQLNTGQHPEPASHAQLCSKLC